MTCAVRYKQENVPGNWESVEGETAAIARKRIVEATEISRSSGSRWVLSSVPHGDMICTVSECGASGGLMTLRQHIRQE